jgi:hypothetical protein
MKKFVLGLALVSFVGLGTATAVDKGKDKGKKKAKKEAAAKKSCCATSTAGVAGEKKSCSTEKVAEKPVQ